MCPHKRGVCNSGVWVRRVSAIQGSGLEGCLQFRGLDWRGVCNSGVWIGGVSAIQGSGLEGCLQFRDLG